MDDLSALRLQIEWGADEALQDTPLDRLAASPPAAASPLQPPPPRRPTLAPLGGPAQATQAAAAADTLEALHAALDAFDCPLRATASTTVRPSGDPAAGLVLLGEAPGPDDDRAGQAFSGAAGARMDRVLASAGLGRDTLMLALMVPWRPPGGRPVGETELALCLPFLHRLLALARPRRLVLMGAGPYRALTGDPAGFRKARGTWRDLSLPGVLPPTPTLTMLAPDTWLSTPTNRQATWTDLLALRTAP